MNDIAVQDKIPAGFRELRLGHSGFMAATGPLYGLPEGDRIVVGFRVEARHCNPNQVCHGGMLMTLADMSLGLGTNYQAKLMRFLPTVNLTCDFLAPAPLGCWVEARTDVLRTTRNLTFGQCMITADGVACARASGIMKVAGEADPRFRLDRLFG